MSDVKTNNNFQVIVGDRDYTKHTIFPIKWSKLLDERLDETRLSIKRLKRNVIPPLTPATITMTDKKGRQIVLDTVVTTDESGEVPVGKKTYNHEIMCLEQTKILEGIVVEALTFTNDLGRNYTKNAKYVAPDAGSSGSYAFTPPNQQPITVRLEFPDTVFLSPAVKDSELIVPAVNKMSLSLVNDPYKDKCTSTREIIVDNISQGVERGNYFDDTAKTIKLTGSVYDIKYSYALSGQWQSQGATFSYHFVTAPNHEPLPRWNIASVIDRVLDLCETHLEGVEPRFKLNAEQHAEFEKIEAPEFAFTNCTLKEILDQIGGYIHGIPRLKGNTIYYDMLGGTKQAKIANPKYPYISNMYSQDIESYCSSLDSTVDNLVCLTDREQGTITEPYYNGYKTVRTETVYARITEENMFIATQYPIQEIQSVKCGIIPGKDFSGGDITAYVFEEAEYARMSAYSNDYPSSKSYALYYTQGTKNIYGLGFKRINVNGNVLGDYAIVNIINKNTGQNIGNLGRDYPLLSFQISYIPVFSARVQQTKQYIGDFKEPRTLVYNQNANLIETRHYGENLKGVVARMGNVDRVVTYNLGDFSLIPEIGELYDDDYYIAGVTCELYPTLIKCMLTLSQDFNRLSQYIGINSTRRFYEVSEKQAYRRDIKYADYLVIGDYVPEDETVLGFFGQQAIKRSFDKDTRAHDAVSYTIATGYNGDKMLDISAILPVVSTAQGNAMVFTFNYEDNYSAGVQSQQETDGGVSGYFTNAVQYADYYGRIDSLAFTLGGNKPVDESMRQQIELALPQNISNLGGTHYGNGRLHVKKDGAEILSINYILEFVTNKRNYIIGSALARYCPLVRGASPDHYGILYVLPKRIGKFTDKVDLNGATEIKSSGFFSNGTTWKFANFTPTVDGAAWAIVDAQNKELMLGSNEPLTAGKIVLMPYISLRHDIYNLGGKNN